MEKEALQGTKITISRAPVNKYNIKMKSFRIEQTERQGDIKKQNQSSSPPPRRHLTTLSIKRTMKRSVRYQNRQVVP